MIVKLFATYDSVGQLWNQNFPAPNAASALRGFAEAANDPTTYVGKHPKDYILYEIGTYDDKSGVLTGLSPQIRLGIGSEYVTLKKSDQ